MDGGPEGRQELPNAKRGVEGGPEGRQELPSAKRVCILAQTCACTLDYTFFFTFTVTQTSGGFDLPTNISFTFAASFSGVFTGMG